MLDALAIASMPEAALVPRLAAMWVRENQNRAPYNRVEVERWIKREFGPVVDQDDRERVCKELVIECKRQIRLRERRGKRRAALDVYTLPVGDPLRFGALLNSRLGPARRWAAQQRLAQNAAACQYIDGDLFSGLVAGLVPVKMRLRRIEDPNLLVYRQGNAEPQTRFVPGWVTTVVDAFLWLIPVEAQAFLKLPGVRVEHDGEAQAIHLITQWGTKVLPWRELVSSPTD